MIKNVTVVGVDVPKAGEKHPRFTLHYVGNDGKTWKIGNLAVKLTEESREKLKAAAVELVGGVQPTLGIEVAKEGNYWNLLTVGDPVKEATTTGKKQSGGYDSLGNQVGNCVTNSVNSLGAGKTISEYKTRAVEFMLMGNEIRELAESGQLETEIAKPTELATNDEEVTKELGF